MDARTYVDRLLNNREQYPDSKERAYRALGATQAMLQTALDRLSPKDRAFMERIMKP